MTTLSILGRIHSRAKRARTLDRRKYAMPLGEDRLSLATGEMEGVDTGKASATFRISTPSRDRDRDVMDMGGCLPHIESYQVNPIVLYDHMTEPGPVGLSEDESGNFQFKAEQGGITATCHFHQLTQHAADICALTMGKILRMASIGFRPLKAVQLQGGGHNFQEWELTEWSICAIGANPEALRLHLDKGVVKSLGIRKSLEPYAAKAKGRSFSKGVSIMADEKDKPLDEEEKMGFDPDEMEAKADETDEDALGDDLPIDETAEDEATDEVPEEDDIPEEVEKEDLEEPAAPQPGAMMLAKIMGMCKAMADALGADLSTMGDMANPKHPVVKFANEMMTYAQKAMESVTGLAGQHYEGADLEKLLAPPEEEQQQKPLPLEEPMTKGKRYRVERIKRLSKAHSATITECKEYMEDVADSNDVPKKYRGGMKHYAKSLGDMLEGEKETDLATKSEDLPIEDEKKCLSLLDVQLKRLRA